MSHAVDGMVGYGMALDACPLRMMNTLGAAIGESIRGTSSIPDPPAFPINRRQPP